MFSCLLPSAFRRIGSAPVNTIASRSLHASPVSQLKQSLYRVRKVWTKEEDEKLLNLYAEMGPRWTAISRHFKNRLPAAVRVHVFRLLEAQDTDPKHDSYLGYTGPWTDEEIAALRSAMKGKDPNQVNWETIQAQLPRKRPPLLLKNTWKHSLDPKLRHGRWTPEESDALAKLVKVYGTNNWDAVADGIPTRSRRQCLERWRWQQDRNIEKGFFTQAEDRLLLAAVEKHGDTDWPLIASVMKTGRTPRQLASRYKYAFDPDTDRSEWTEEERLLVYNTYQQLQNMKEVQSQLGTKRCVKDMWNQYMRVCRNIKQGLPDPGNDQRHRRGKKPSVVKEMEYGKMEAMQPADTPQTQPNASS